MLPKPLAIFSANDHRGRQALDACMSAGISVPYEAIVLGVDNDQLVCETGQLTLSSIAIDSEGAGFMAAEMLDRMMKGIKPEHRTYGPSEIVLRESTAFLAASDPTVIKAIEFIRINTGFQIRVSDVAKHLECHSAMARKTFQKASWVFGDGRNQGSTIKAGMQSFD